jgi:hypothetical protein
VVGEQNGDAPRTPFATPEYHLNVGDQAKQQAEQADLNSQEVQRANRNSDTYTPLTVLFSISLFLAGLVTGFISRFDPHRPSYCSPWLTSSGKYF